MRTLAFALLIVLAPSCFAAAKYYQAAKFVGADTQAYTKIVPLNSYGMTVSKHRHEDELSFQLGDVIYVGRCDERDSKCRPANWIVGDVVQIRLDKGHLYVQLSGGKELKTEVIERRRPPAK